MGVWEGFCCSAPQYGRAEDTHRNTRTHTHTRTYTRILHLPFSDLPFKKCPNCIVRFGCDSGTDSNHAMPTARETSTGGAEEKHTHTQRNTHTQERTREWCTYPLATYPLKSARISRSLHFAVVARFCKSRPQLKALETTTATKQHKISCNSCGDC